MITETETDISLDLDSSWKPSRGMHGDIPSSAPDDQLEAKVLFPLRLGFRNHFVGPGRQPVGGQVNLIG
jgi:hypothetical protein